ncbi:YdcF family protein [Paramixta manurensis]|uniref:YdcF family protein n=1 Tax=Paramixta manurensis TaxID=2740817 RepID=A0A6M8UDM6_9GAMM|nr:YdcF family protein [Erwiniaceae bacterium PD-1]
MKFNAQEIAAVNQIAAWLACDELASCSQWPEAPLMILAGHAVLPNIEGAFALARRHSLRLLLSGGVGHSTDLLREAIAAHPLYHTLPCAGLSEAEILGALAVEFCGIAPGNIMLETASTNCGQNAAFSRRLLAAEATPARILLVQDPLMQRRTLATFRHEWRTVTQAPQFISWPVFTPYLKHQQGMTRIAGAAPQGLWSLERFISLLLGEIPRLRDDAQGYGPCGKGFIEHVDMPLEIEAAWQQLMTNPACQKLASR